ncbi:MAG TPA: hypothetical protein VGM33_11610 [Baekduia sp.]|jgi:hypothetical protein
MAPKKKAPGRGFTPFQQERPPVGYYDPSFDAAQAAAGRGLGDLQQDSDTQNLRDTVDYGLGMDALGRTQARGLADIETQRGQIGQGYDRSIADLDTAGARGQQDHDQAIVAMQRRYSQLGDTQRQQQAQHGVMRGGAMLQAAAKRTANQAIDQAPIDQQLQRQQQDIGTQRARLGEDRTSQLGQLGTAQGRLNDDTTLQQGQLGLMQAPPDANNPFGGRSFQDRTTALTRAQRENSAFGLDSDASRAYEASGQGWTPPTAPSNEFVDAATGQHRQTQIRGNNTVAIDQYGKVLWKRPRRAA